ncbi:MAG: CHAT domain-containing protein [bacterium]|nr:CHAT domain-containing protein [bacterium]
MTDRLLEEAAAAVAMAREDPHSALQLTERVIAASTDDDTLATAHFACGLAHRALANGAESTKHLEIAGSSVTPHTELRGQILRSLAFNYAQSGRNDLADATIEESIALLTGHEQDLSRVQHTYILMMRGDLQGALPVLDQAIESFAASGDDGHLELLYGNRALIHLESGDADMALRDLERRYEIAMRLDHPVSAADAALHLSQALGWLDDIPGAMKWHDRSTALRESTGVENPIAEAEHAYLLIQARLIREAEELLVSWIPRLEDAGDRAVVGQAHLQLAEVLLARGAFKEAAEQVALAHEATPPDGRYRFDVAAAGHKVRIALGDLTPALLKSMLNTASDMEANGERHTAASERFRAVDVALAIGNVSAAASMCDEAAAIVRSGPLWLQIQAWTALAKVRKAAGNRRGAAAAARAGFGRLDEYRGGIGAADLRIHASELGTQLAGIGIELALESRSVHRIFDWSERLRTASMSSSKDSAPNPAIGAALVQLRHATARLRSASGDRIPALRREAATCEREVRQLARQARASRRTFATPRLADIQAQLSQRTLVEFVETSGQVGAIIATSETAGWIDLDESPQARELLDHLRFAAERIARPSTSDASRTAALESVSQLVGQIRDQLIDPLEIDTNRAVVVPSAVLHGVPWGLVLDIPVEVAPSATVWLASRTAPPSSPSTLIVHGPGLEHATTEVNEIKAIAGGTVASTVPETLEMLSGVTLAHFACHARPRLDSPMFSSLVLDDGELTLYDIERLPQVPSTVVLAACDGGSAVMASGDEVLGLANAFLSLGSTTVVAPLFTVSDEATASVMRSVHRSLAAGNDAATALLAARQTPDALIAFTAGSFACFGA